MASMDIKQLQALIAIGDHGSFSDAARALGTVQSNVSSRIKALESSLDAVLVDRSTGRLTRIGEAVAKRAQRIEIEFDAIVDDVVALQSGVSGLVSVGMIGTTGRWLVPALFATMRERHPNVRLEVLEGTNSTLETGLANGQLDVAVVNLPIGSRDVDSFPLFQEDLCLVIAHASPIAERHRSSAKRGAPYHPVALAELGEMELLLPLKGTTLRDQIDAAVAGAGVVLTAIIELEGIRMLASLAFDGHGPALLPASAIPQHIRAEFAAIPLETSPHRTVGVAVRRRGFPAASTRVVVEVMKEIVRSTEVLPEGIAPITLTASL